MILILLGLLTWIPAVAGWGSLLTHIPYVNLLSVESTDDIHEPIMGMALLATLATALNFFVPITEVISGLILLLGWGLCWLRFRIFAGRKLPWKLIMLAVLWLIVVAFWSTQPPRHYDTGLYHLQAIRWVTERVSPLGLANLHGRLGFNSSWFPLAALLKFPISMERSVPGSFLLFALPVWFYGVMVIKAMLALMTQLSQSNIFLVLTTASLIKEFQFMVSSPQPDLGVFLLTLSMGFISLRMFELQRNWSNSLWALLICALFSITIKLSALPLILIPVSLSIYAYWHKIPVAWKKLLPLTLMLVGVILVPWMIRGVLQSGCLAYPVAVTCLSGLPWGVSSSMAHTEALIIGSFARAPYSTTWVHFGDPGWFLPWLSGMLKSPDIIGPAIYLIAGLILSQCVSQRPLQSSMASMKLVWLILPLVIGIVYWFIAAPSLRFGLGYFWVLGASTLSVKVYELLTVRPITQVIALVKKALVFSIGGVAIMGIVLIMGAPMKALAKRPLGEFLFTWPKIPDIPVSTHWTANGVPVSMPQTGEQCWNTPLPCTPQLPDALWMGQLSGNRLSLLRGNR